MTRTEYDNLKVKIEKLIAKATAKGMLSPDADNEYTQEIARLSAMGADYEDSELEIMPLRVKTPLIISIEQAMAEHSIKQRELASMLEVNESTLSLVLSGKRHLSMRMAKRLYHQLNIDPKLIVEYS